MHRIVAAFCIWLMIGPPPATAQAGKQVKPALKEQVILIAAGSVVEVDMKNRQKIRGRIGAVTDDGFDLQHVRNDKAITQTIRFDEVRKIKQKEHGMSTGGEGRFGRACRTRRIFPGCDHRRCGRRLGLADNPPP